MNERTTYKDVFGSCWLCPFIYTPNSREPCKSCNDEEDRRLGKNNNEEGGTHE